MLDAIEVSGDGAGCVDVDGRGGEDFGNGGRSAPHGFSDATQAAQRRMSSTFFSWLLLMKLATDDDKPHARQVRLIIATGGGW